MRGKRLVPLLFAASLLVLALPQAGTAGTPVDPNLNDTWLGTVGGVRYATDSASFDAGNSDYAEVSTGCGGSAWHLVGGGSNAGGARNQAALAVDQPNDFNDADTLTDDGWNSSAHGSPPAKLHSYTTCIKHPGLSYPLTDVPDGSSGQRTASAPCPVFKHVTGGGMFIATTGSWESSSYPYDGPDKDKIPDDGWKGGVFDTLGGPGGMQAYAVCATGLKLDYVKKGPSPVPVKHAVSLRVACPVNEHVVGGGVKLTGAQNMGRMFASFPYDSTDKGKTPDDGWQIGVYNLGGGKKTATGWAICLG